MKGIHYIIDYEKLPFDTLNNLSDLNKLFEKVIKISKTNILGKKFHKFKPQGLTWFYLLSESHLSFHSWPELGSISIDLYTCGDKKKAEESITFLKNYLLKKFNNKNYKIRKIIR